MSLYMIHKGNNWGEGGGVDIFALHNLLIEHKFSPCKIILINIMYMANVKFLYNA